MPIDRRMPTSLAWSYRLALMFAEREKKQRNIIIPIVDANIPSKSKIVWLLFYFSSLIDTIFNPTPDGTTSRNAAAISSIAAWSV